LLALFVALGGSALAFGKAVKPVVRCGNGSVKAYAAVNLDSYAGAFPTSFSSEARNFTARYSCTGTAAQVRRVGHGVYEIRFPGVPARSAVVSGDSYNGAQVSWTNGAEGSFRVTVLSPSGYPSDFGFSIAVF
jgi:hypothetical protein